MLICRDFNVDYLLNDNCKQQLSVLLNAFSMVHTVNFLTRLQNNYASAIDNILVDESRLSSCITLPLCIALSDHDAQCFILQKYLLLLIKLTINQEIDINLDCRLVKLLIISLNSNFMKHGMKFILILSKQCF
jgi:hypothetical protein